MKNKNLYIITCFLILTTSYLSAAKRGRSQLRIPTETTSQQQATISSTTLDFGLFDAVVLGDIDKVREILTKHHNSLNEQTINKSFSKTVTGRKKNFKPEIALLFLEHSEIKAKLSGHLLDKAVIKSIQRCIEDLFLKIIEDKTLRKKLYTSNETNERFEKVLKYAAKHRKPYLKEVLSYQDLKKKTQHLDCVKKMLPNLSSIKDLASKARNDYGLFDAVVSGDPREILTKHLDNLNEQAINKAFIKTMTGEAKNLKPEIALLFLEFPKVKAKLSGYALDKVFMKSIRSSSEDVFLTIIGDKALRQRLYTDSRTKKPFNALLNYASKSFKPYLKNILSYRDLKKRMLHLDSIKNIIPHLDSIKNLTPQPIQYYGLFEAIASNDVLTVREILTQHQEDLSTKVINRAFTKAVTGQKKNIRPEVALLFLDQPKVKERILGQALDKAIIISIHFKKATEKFLEDLFVRIIEDKALREKLYTNKSKESFEKALKYASKYINPYFKKILSYPDLKKKIQHLECISNEIPEASSQEAQESAQQITFQNNLSTLEEDSFKNDFNNNSEQNYPEEETLLTFQSHPTNAQEESFGEYPQEIFPFLFLGEEEIPEPLFSFEDDLDLESHEPTPLPLQETLHEKRVEFSLEKKIGFFLIFIQLLHLEALKPYLAVEDENNSLPIISGAPLVKSLEILEQHLARNDDTIKQNVCLILEELEKYDILKEQIENYCKNKSASDPNSRLIRLVQERSHVQNASNKNKCEVLS